MLVILQLLQRALPLRRNITPEKSHKLNIAPHEGLAQAKAQSTMQSVIIKHRVMDKSLGRSLTIPLPLAIKVTMWVAGRTITRGDLRTACITWVATMQLRDFSGVVTIWSLALRIDKNHSDSPEALAAKARSHRECRSPPYKSHKHPKARSQFQNSIPFPQHFIHKKKAQQGSLQSKNPHAFSLKRI